MNPKSRSLSPEPKTLHPYSTSSNPQSLPAIVVILIFDDTTNRKNNRNSSNNKIVHPKPESVRQTRKKLATALVPWMRRRVRGVGGSRFWISDVGFRIQDLWVQGLGCRV